MDEALASRRGFVDSGPVPLRPALIPGSRVLRHDARHLVVGTDPGVVVRDRPGLLTLLDLVDGRRDVAALTQLLRGHGIEELDVPATVLELMAAGALVPGPRTPRHPRVEVVALDRAARRLASLVTSAGRDAGWHLVHETASDLVLVSTGEPPRSQAELALTQQRGVLVVAAFAETVRVGPFGFLGRSPCLGCLDRARTDRQPAWPVLVTQLEHPRRAPRPSGADPGTLWRAIATVVDDVALRTQGERPSTHAATLTFGPGPVAPTRHVVPLREDCSCHRALSS